ncbi:hypothetical protein R3P38DRAFT_1724242 [Favolaschia claudopus]|uniref:Uncharacterized protein n=1 Tax=Favolaschia claudopus TaxID=2862362 RepID=A0AAW0ABQ0_9AGAR
MATEAPQNVLVRAFFSDRAHRQHDPGPHFASEPDVVLEYDAAEFSGMRIPSLLTAIQQEHSSASCDRCLTPILVKCAWHLNLEAIATMTPELDLQGPLENDPIGGLTFLESDSEVSDYPTTINSCTDITVFCETMYNRSHSRGTKREMEAPDDAPYMRAKPAQSELVVSQQGLCVIPSADDPTAPLNLPPPSFSFPIDTEAAGVVFIDKTGFFPRLSALLQASKPGCFLALPPGTGKSALLSWYAAWVDAGWDREQWGTLFKTTNCEIWGVYL